MKLPARWQQRWQAWLDRRIPPAAQVTLSHRSIFILPTRSALTFGLLLLLLLITAINYQNSLIYALTFWLFSVGLAAMLFYLFRNLSGLTLIAGHAAPCFAGERLRLPLWLQADRRGHQALLLGFPDQPAQQASVAAGERQALHLSLPGPSARPAANRPAAPRQSLSAGFIQCLELGAAGVSRAGVSAPGNRAFVFLAGDGGEQLSGAPSAPNPVSRIFRGCGRTVRAIPCVVLPGSNWPAVRDW